MELADAKDAFPEFTFDTLRPRSGGFKNVFYVSRDGEELVLKVFKSTVPDEPDDDETVVAETDYQRIQIELQAISDLNHPNIVTLIQPPSIRRYGSEQHVFYVEKRFPFVLSDISDSFPWDCAKALEFFKGLLSGISAVHAGGYIHRDIKPMNIAIDAEERPVLIDFGSAYAPAEVRTTRPGTVAPYTTHYAAPEQLDATVDPDARTDLFQIGVVMYSICTGQHPFPVKNWTKDAWLAAVNSGPNHQLILDACSDGGLADAVLRCLEAEPFMRFRSAHVALEALA